MLLHLVGALHKLLAEGAQGADLLGCGALTFAGLLKLARAVFQRALLGAGLLQVGLLAINIAQQPIEPGKAALLLVARGVQRIAAARQNGIEFTVAQRERMHLPHLGIQRAALLAQAGLFL
jgi:hypothetical protein